MTRYLVFCLVVFMLGCQAPLGAEAPVAMLVQPSPTLLTQGTQSTPQDDAAIFGWRKKKKSASTVGSSCSKGKPGCATGQFCDLKTEGSSCSSATSGACAEMPSICTRDFRPVCGCDNKTYSNDCARKAAGVSLSKLGACEEVTTKPGKEPLPGSALEGAMCGGIAGFRCEAGLFCEVTEKDGLTCNTSDRAGICAVKPDLCTFDFRPVCGCDGKTYSNDCTRKAAGVARSAEGACSEKPTISEAPIITKPAGSRLPMEGVLLTLEPKACKSNPWEKTKETLPKIEATFADKELSTIAAFFQLKKLNLVELGLLKAAAPIATCRACNCPRGDILTVVAKKEDVETLKKDYGFAEIASSSYLTATPLACDMNPWAKLEGADESAKIVAHLKGEAVEAQYLGLLFSTTPRITCAACTCPRGDRLIVKTKDNTKTTAGFTAVP
jgi:hypothetical protein